MEGLLKAPGMDGDPRVRAAIESGRADMESVLQAFPFELDAFQQQAVRELLDGRSVVVCAPTGAGKTAIAEAAAIACLAMGQRAIYTTPLKALRRAAAHRRSTVGVSFPPSATRCPQLAERRI